MQFLGIGGWTLEGHGIEEVAWCGECGHVGGVGVVVDAL